MATLNAKIYKKVSSTGTPSNDYVLYHPETGAEQVVYTKTWDSKNYTTVSGILDDITLKLDGVGGVLEFCGDAASLAAASSKAGTNAKGEVYVITSTFSWKSQEYPANTLIVFTVDDPDATPSDSQFVPLGGSNSVYSTKNETLSTVSLSGSTFTFKYADHTDSRSHKIDITVPTIGTTAVGTTTITGNVTSGGDNDIPNVAAVKAFAGSAGRLNTTTATNDSTYYIVGVESATTASNQTPYTMGLPIKKYATPNQNTGAAGWINVQVAQADHLTNGLQIGSLWYDGGSAFTVSAGTGIAIGNGTNSATISLSASGVASGTYSAVQVDIYGRALAGAQSLVFANSLQDPDLNQLVVGGLAFVSSSETAKTGTVPTNNINLDN